MVDHFEDTVAKNQQRSAVHLSEIKDLLEPDFVNDQEPEDISSSATVELLPADHIFHCTPETVQTESMAVESLNLVGHFDVMENQMLNDALKNPSQSTSDKTKGSFEPEFGLLQQHELEQLENISINMKVILLLIVLFMCRYLDNEIQYTCEPIFLDINFFDSLETTDITPHTCSGYLYASSFVIW